MMPVKMVPPRGSYAPRGFPRWIHYLVTALSRVGRWLSVLVLMGGAARALAGQVTLPPSGRADNLCHDLGTEAPCDTQEVAHLRGTFSFLVNDGALSTVGILVARQRTLGVDLGAPPNEATFLEEFRDPLTLWNGLIPPQSTWAALRQMARVTEAASVPMLSDLTPTRAGMDQADNLLPSTGVARVRISFRTLTR
jgi:hypothetical protein